MFRDLAFQATNSVINGDYLADYFNLCTTHVAQDLGFVHDQSQLGFTGEVGIGVASKKVSYRQEFA